MFSPESDAVTAAPKHHRLAFENEVVRVLETLVEAGETVPLHTHEWPAASYVFSFSNFIRRNEAGVVTLDTAEQGICFQTGETIWSTALELHTLENVGTSPLHLISVEVKSLDG